MKIERVVSPGGIEAWLVESHANPLIAMRFAFRGGASQDDPGKEGLAYFISAMMDEGAGDLDAVAFQEREQGLAFLKGHGVEIAAPSSIMAEMK